VLDWSLSPETLSGIWTGNIFIAVTLFHKELTLVDWGIPNPFPPAVIPWTEPPSQPITGQCKLKWRCWNIFAGNRHCGLVMSVDGAVTTIDGTGGEENHIDWPPEPYLPGGDGGIQV